MFIVIHMRFAVCVFQKSPGIGPQIGLYFGELMGKARRKVL